MKKLKPGEAPEMNRYWAWLFAPACSGALLRMIEKRLIAHDLLHGGWRPVQIAKEIFDQCDEEQIHALALERIRHVIVAEILAEPDVCKRLYREAEALRSQRSSVDRLVEEIGGQ